MEKWGWVIEKLGIPTVILFVILFFMRDHLLKIQDRQDLIIVSTAMTLGVQNEVCRLLAAHDAASTRVREQGLLRCETAKQLHAGVLEGIVRRSQSLKEHGTLDKLTEERSILPGVPTEFLRKP